MFRKQVAVLLVLSWIALSAFDVLEDLDVPDQTEAHSSEQPLPAGSGQIARVANNIVESADHPSRRQSIHMKELAVKGSPEILTPYRKASKLHKLHSVFVI